MIEIEKEYEVAIQLRQNIIDMVAGVKDAPNLFWGDDTSPNYMTESALKDLIGTLDKTLKSFGGIKVFEHAPCGADQHFDHANGSLWAPKSMGHWRMVLGDGGSESSVVKNGHLFINNIAMDNSEPSDSSDALGKITPCPCGTKRPKDHMVICYHVWPKTDYTRLGMFYDCFDILNDARVCAGPKKRRSAVREQLLKCIILLNDNIVPLSAQQYIEDRTARGP
jgi:hypothetical protein